MRYKKNTEANTKVYDLNQKTIQALDRLAGVYYVLKMREQTFKTRGDILYADVC